jgi:hypothetical protein
MADLQAKLDDCERKLRSRENDSQDDGEGSLESPTQRRSSLQSPSSVESPAEQRSTPADSTVSSSGGKTTTKSVEQEGPGFPNPLVAEKRNKSHEAEIGGVQVFSPPAADHVRDKESWQPGSCGTDGM